MKICDSCALPIRENVGLSTLWWRFKKKGCNLSAIFRFVYPGTKGGPLPATESWLGRNSVFIYRNVIETFWERVERLGSQRLKFPIDVTFPLHSYQLAARENGASLSSGICMRAPARLSFVRRTSTWPREAIVDCRRLRAREGNPWSRVLAFVFPPCTDPCSPCRESASARLLIARTRLSRVVFRVVSIRYPHYRGAGIVWTKERRALRKSRKIPLVISFASVTHRKHIQSCVQRQREKEREYVSRNYRY